MVSWASVGPKSQRVAWLGVALAATPGGPNTEALGVLASSLEEEVWSVLAAGEEKVSKASGKALGRQSSNWVPATLKGWCRLC